MELSFSSPSPLPLHGEIAKALPLVMLETKKLLLSVGDVVGLEPLQTITRPLCCQIIYWLGVHKDLKALSHTIQ